jgi:hypothetical protein
VIRPRTVPRVARYSPIWFACAALALAAGFALAFLLID